MEFNKFAEIRENANLTTLAEKVKGLPAFEVYKEEVLKNGEDTTKKLGITMMLFSMADEELSMMMQTVAHDLLFNALNLRFRSEILGSKCD